MTTDEARKKLIEESFADRGDKMKDCATCPDLKCEHSANLIWYCKNDTCHASCNTMLKPGGQSCSFLADVKKLVRAMNDLAYDMAMDRGPKQ